MQRLAYNTIAFDSMADLANFMTEDKTLHPHQHDSWYGRLDGAASLAMIRTGDTSCVADAEKLLDQFDIHLASYGSELDVSPAGFMPCVPLYVGGEPECMYDLVACETDAQPIKVLVDPTSSAGITTPTLRLRGTTILAAVMALAAIRPVKLEVACLLDASADRVFTLPALPAVDGSGGRKRRANVCQVRVGINSTPLDLASAGYALSHPAFARHVLYGVARHTFGSPLRWPTVTGVNMHDTRSAATQAVAYELLQEDPAHTLFIPAISLTDPIVSEPKKWLAEVLAKYGQTALA